MNPSDLSEGSIVLIAAFDDVPEHQFEVHDIHEDCVTGMAITGPLAGCYGEPPLEMVLRIVDRLGTR